MSKFSNNILEFSHGIHLTENPLLVDLDNHENLIKNREILLNLEQEKVNNKKIFNQRQNCEFRFAIKFQTNMIKDQTFCILMERKRKHSWM